MCLQPESPIYIVKAYCSLLESCQYEQIENLEKPFSKLFLIINYQLSHGSVENSIEILICISDIIEYKASIITNIVYYYYILLLLFSLLFSLLSLSLSSYYYIFRWIHF